MLPATLLLLALAAQAPAAARPDAAAAPAASPRTIAIDDRLAADAGLRVGDLVLLRAEPGGVPDSARVGAVVRRSADPSEVSRNDHRVRLRLTHLQALAGYGDRVDRFAVAAAGTGAARDAATDSVLRRVNDVAFGFRAHRSRDVAVETSRTFAVVSRFHRAIGVITIVASAIFLLCIMLLKVEERRRDVAALRLMGISRATIVKAVVLEASAIALAGAALGVVVGWAASQGVNAYYQGVYATPLVFSLVTPDIVLLAVGLSVVLGVAAGWLAALRLVRARPLALLGR